MDGNRSNNNRPLGAGGENGAVLTMDTPHCTTPPVDCKWFVLTDLDAVLADENAAMSLQCLRSTVLEFDVFEHEGFVEELSDDHAWQRVMAANGG